MHNPRCDLKSSRAHGNGSSLILLDWINGLTFELKWCVSHDLHPIKCAELGHMFDA